jgi:hypothetical protein
MDNPAFRIFLEDVKKRATALVGEEYISEDVRKVLRDFLQATESFASLYSESVGQSADSRVLKKRYEQLKSESKANEKRIEQMKSSSISSVASVKVISAEITSITDPASLARIKTALQKIAETLIEITKI